MIYKTILTSKGTTTIPKAIRDQLGVKPGMLISFTKNQATGEFVLKRAQTIVEIREANRLALKKAGTAHKHYETGAGYSTHVTQDLRAR